MDRFYRKHMISNDLLSFNVKYLETDLFISAKSDISVICEDYIIGLRKKLDNYIELRPEFKKSFVPVAFDEKAPETARRMMSASESAGVGPMAAVAGAFAQMLCERMLEYSDEMIVENGGDLYMTGKTDRTVGIYAGENRLKDKLFIRVPGVDLPISVCTSSSKFGHSFSFGNCDAAVILSHDGALADAAATGMCNRVKTPADIEKALEYASLIKGAEGAVVVCDGKIGAWGEIEFVGK